MSRGRFQPVQTFERDGCHIAQVHDTKSGRDCFVYQPGIYWLHWDREDRPVTQNTLKEIARRMLAAKPAQPSLVDRVETIWDLHEKGHSAEDALARAGASA